MIKVLHVMTRIPVGGVENQLLQVVKSYNRTRFSPCVISLSEKGAIGREIEAEGVEVIALKKLGHQFSFSLFRDLVSAINSIRPDVLRTHQYHANFYGRMAVRRKKIPCVVPSVHNIYTRDCKPHRRFFNNMLAKCSDSIVAVSEAVKRDIVHFDRVKAERIKVIYNGVDIERFKSGNRQTIRSSLGIDDETKLVGTVGRLIEQKGQRYLIEAMSLLPHDIPHWKLLIVGAGPLNKDLRELAAGLGIQDRVIFTGSRRDIPDLLSAMDIFVMPSLWEGLGVALIEAMVAGKPVIATDIPPFMEIIREGKTGLAVPVMDSKALASSIQSLLIDSAMTSSLAKKGRKSSLKRFSIENTVSTYCRLFEDILKGKCTPAPVCKSM